MHNVRDFGAAGDGATRDTAAIQRALDAGGVAYLPPGEYLTGTLYLRSNGGLELAPGAVLRGSPNPADYDENCCEQNRVFASEMVSGAHLLVACEVQNVVIRGGGRIHGNREAFFSGAEDPVRPGKFLRPEWRPGQMLFFCESAGITITDVELYESPYWCCFLHGCEHVNIRGVRIMNHRMTPNSDGIDLDCCRFVTVSDCRIDSGDDCITLRANAAPLKNPRPCEKIAVTNCVLSSPCQAIRVGVGDGVIRDAVVSNLVIHDTRSGIQLVSRYSSKSPGVTIENILFSNIAMKCRRPLAVLSDVRGARDEDVKPIRRVGFRNIRAEGDRSCFFEANRRGDVSDLTLDGVDLIYGGGDDIVDGAGLAYGEFGVKNSPAAFHLKNLADCSFNRVRVRWRADASPLWKYGLWCEASEAPELSECRFERDVRMD
jgi:polygalacturonase